VPCACLECVTPRGLFASSYWTPGWPAHHDCQYAIDAACSVCEPMPNTRFAIVSLLLYGVLLLQNM
jgi:hypothetical protein